MACVRFACCRARFVAVVPDDWTSGSTPIKGRTRLSMRKPPLLILLSCMCLKCFPLPLHHETKLPPTTSRSHPRGSDQTATAALLPSSSRRHRPGPPDDDDQYEQPQYPPTPPPTKTQNNTTNDKKDDRPTPSPSLSPPVALSLCLSLCLSQTPFWIRHGLDLAACLPSDKTKTILFYVYKVIHKILMIIITPEIIYTVIMYYKVNIENRNVL